MNKVKKDLIADGKKNKPKVISDAEIDPEDQEFEQDYKDLKEKELKQNLKLSRDERVFLYTLIRYIEIKYLLNNYEEEFKQFKECLGRFCQGRSSTP